jgi:phosphatidylserine/phosphatidylglycerophosphate/cardiolipin synthase-like enzyme
MVIESLEPRERVFVLNVKLGKETSALRPKVEAILRRYKRITSCAASPRRKRSTSHRARHDATDRVSGWLTALPPDGKGGVEWKEGTKVENQVKLIVQPEAGVTPVIQAIRLARKQIDIVIFRLDRKEVELALGHGGSARRGVRALIAHTKPRWGEPPAQARATPAGRKESWSPGRRTICSAITASS